MDYSSANLTLWNPILQIGIIAVVILVSNIFRRKVLFMRKSLMPTAVIGGFLLLLVKLLGIIPVDLNFMESLTYHCIAIGFIALSLRVPEKTEKETGDHTGLRSGAIIVGSYMIQGIAGLVISLGLACTVKPDMFKAAGILLPLGFGQGPGQANNTGTTYETVWGFAGGRSFGLALAAMGYVCACVIGVIYMNVLVKKGKFRRIDHEMISGSVTVDTFQAKDEVPIAESLDRLSIQTCLVIAVYLATYLITWGITSALSRFAPGVGNLVNGLLWGFNFIVGSALAILMRSLLKALRGSKIITHQYQNNYLLSRISGLAFDVMIVAGIASIELEDLSGLWLPFVLMTVAGAVVTYFHLRFVCSRVYPDYFYQSFLSMYGMMTGTISSGVLLLRELDPQLETPAANNLVIGSSFAILFGIPMLILIGLAPKSPAMAYITLGCLIVYYFILVAVACRKHEKK